MKALEVFILVVLVSALLIFIAAVSPNRRYELVTQDNVVIIVDGHCQAKASRVECDGVYYYDIKEFREIK